MIARVTELNEVPDTEKQSTEDEVPGIASVNPDSSDKRKRLQELLKELKINENILLTKNPKIKASVVRLLAKYLNMFAHEQQQYGNTDKVEFSVELKEGVKPVKSTVRPLNPDQHASLQQQLTDWEREGIIKKTSSPWASALIPVRKKIEPLDAASAYNTIKVAVYSQAALAFISPFGLYTFARMPFGAHNAGLTYARFIGDLIDQLGCQYIECYLDDILIHTPDLETHEQQLEQVLAIHQEPGILLKAKKCYLFCTEVSYLGHRVNKHGISMELNYVERIME